MTRAPPTGHKDGEGRGGEGDGGGGGEGDGGGGGEGGGGGGGEGGVGSIRGPQSVQSVPTLQTEYAAPGPPSSHKPSEA